MTPTPWSTRRWCAMGSDAHVVVAAEDDGLVGRAVDEVERLERCWSRFRSDSQLCALNASPECEVEVDPMLATAVRRAVLAWELTDGWFDPTVIDALEHAGYDVPFVAGRRARGAAWSPPPPVRTPLEVDVDPVDPVIRRPPGLRLDLGGIGKGLAADIVANDLIAAGATSVCVSLGGDVRVTGTPPDGGWQIPIERPGAPGTTWSTATLADGGLAASTTRLRRWRTGDGEVAHHLIDPRSGRSSTSGLSSVVAVAAETWWAEVLAKAALIAGPERGRRLIERHRAAAWFDEDPGPRMATELAG